MNNFLNYDPPSEPSSRAPNMSSGPNAEFQQEVLRQLRRLAKYQKLLCFLKMYYFQPQQRETQSISLFSDDFDDFSQRRRDQRRLPMYLTDMICRYLLTEEDEE